ncbi:NAD-dependent epimerase/dehydratase family protein [Salinimicrobium sp. CAU 1759]
MKVIITGASGFVGQNLIRYFEEKGKQTIPLSMRKSDWKKNFPKSAAAVIHLAGKAHDTANTSSEETYYQVNTGLTRQVFEAYLESDIPDFIYLSSVKAVADTVEDVLTEKEEPLPSTPYGKSKLRAEEYLLSRSLPPGRRLFILRPCMIHGPGNKGNLNLLYKTASKGIPWPLGAFDNRRSFCSMDNLAFITGELLKNKDIPSGIYNIADEEAISTIDLIKVIAAARGKKARILNVPAGLIKNISKAGDIFNLPLNSERLKKLTESYVVDNSKIKKAVGKPLPLKTREGLLKTIKSFANVE